MHLSDDTTPSFSAASHAAVAEAESHDEMPPSSAGEVERAHAAAARAAKAAAAAAAEAEAAPVIPPVDASALRTRRSARTPAAPRWGWRQPRRRRRDARQTEGIDIRQKLFQVKFKFSYNLFFFELKR